MDDRRGPVLTDRSALGLDPLREELLRERLAQRPALVEGHRLRGLRVGQRPGAVDPREARRIDQMAEADVVRLEEGPQSGRQRPRDLDHPRDLGQVEPEGREQDRSLRGGDRPLLHRSHCGGRHAPSLGSLAVLGAEIVL
ncbi:hypothetical protein [Brachybacterium nesterenkovii]|uniref:hypothetical protein n=1 Tax=Brachybacterium nesterenkovii TaxID=47847 RepID=UPI00321B9C6E